MNNYFFRPAKFEDADFLAWTALTASRSNMPKGFWDVIVDDSDQYVLEFIKKVLLSDKLNFCHYSFFTVAEVQGRCIGALSGFANNDPNLTPMLDVINNAVLAQGWNNEKVQRIHKGLKVMAECVPEEIIGSWEIEWAACLTKYQRQGVMIKLIDQVLNVGKKKGYNNAQALIRTSNTPILTLLHKFGFKTIDKRSSKEFEQMFGDSGFTRLTLPL